MFATSASKSFASLVLIALLSSGCNVADLEPYTGLWSATGTMQITVNTPEGPKGLSSQLGGNRNFLEGVSSDLLMVYEQCSIPLQVSEDVAQVQSGFTCTWPNGEWMVAVTYQSGTAIVKGSTMTVTTSGTVTYTGQGASYAGTFISNETLTRVSKAGR
jgi:hypothetical protein